MVKTRRMRDNKIEAGAELVMRQHVWIEIKQ